MYSLHHLPILPLRGSTVREGLLHIVTVNEIYRSFLSSWDLFFRTDGKLAFILDCEDTKLEWKWDEVGVGTVNWSFCTAPYLFYKYRDENADFLCYMGSWKLPLRKNLKGVGISGHTVAEMQPNFEDSQGGFWWSNQQLGRNGWRTELSQRRGRDGGLRLLINDFLLAKNRVAFVCNEFCDLMRLFRFKLCFCFSLHTPTSVMSFHGRNKQDFTRHYEFFMEL